MSKWRYDCTERRDFRRAHDEPEVPKHHSRWPSKQCKRAKDRQHRFAPMPLTGTWKDSCLSRMRKCENCGKEVFVTPEGALRSA